MIVKAYFDRSVETIEGSFTIQEVDNGKVINEPFKRLPVRSGQSKFTRSSWVRSKSPIPFSTEVIEPYRLWLKPLNQGQWAGDTGIGEFFYISTGYDPTLTKSRNGKLTRRALGLHPENKKLPGSAGCIVLLNDTAERKFQVAALFQYLRSLGKEEKHIELVVL